MGTAGNVGVPQIARIDHQQRRLPRRADGQQCFAVAEHVLEQRRFVLDQLQGVAVIEEGAQLIDAADQRGVITADQLLLQFAVQRGAEAGQRGEREQGEHQRQAQGQRIRAIGCSWLRIEAIADATHAVDQLELERVIDLRPQAAHGDIDDVGVAVEIHVPHP